MGFGPISPSAEGCLDLFLNAEHPRNPWGWSPPEGLGGKVRVELPRAVGHLKLRRLFPL